MTDITISNSVLQNKLKRLKEELTANSERSKNLLQEIEHINYIINHAKALSSEKVASRAKRANSSSTITTKDVVINILKGSGREMAWEDILEEFVKVRPDVKPESMRVILSNEVSRKDSKIKKIRDRNNYRYLYSE